MKIYTLIKGEELDITEDYHEKSFSIGSKIQWGNKVWEIIEDAGGCKGCYFGGGGRCYCLNYWHEILGSCSKSSRPDGVDVVFQLKRLVDDEEKSASCM